MDREYHEITAWQNNGSIVLPNEDTNRRVPRQFGECGSLARYYPSIFSVLPSELKSLLAPSAAGHEPR